MTAASPALGLVIAYLGGSIPAAYIAGRLLKGIDLRQHGSGNLGATNVYRVLGLPAAVVVLFFDIAKGAVPVLALPRVFPSDQPLIWAIAYGLAAILGHVFPIFMLWRGGGKGVATAAGVFTALAPFAALIAMAAFAVTFLGSGYISLGSLAGATVLPIALLVTHGPRSPLFFVGLAVSALVFWTHRANIARLRRGEEPRFGRKDVP